MPQCHGATMPNATMPRCQYAMPMFNDANVQHDDATRRCRLNATMQSQGRYETRHSLTRRRLDATVPRCHDAKCDDATMPDAMPMFNATIPTQCHDAESRQIRDEAESNTTKTRCHGTTVP